MNNWSNSFAIFTKCTLGTNICNIVYLHVRFKFYDIITIRLLIFMQLQSTQRCRYVYTWEDITCKNMSNIYTRIRITIFNAWNKFLFKFQFFNLHKSLQSNNNNNNCIPLQYLKKFQNILYNMFIESIYKCTNTFVSHCLKIYKIHFVHYMFKRKEVLYLKNVERERERKEISEPY